MLAVPILVLLRITEINENGVEVVINHNIFWLEVIVSEAALVNFFDYIQKFLHNLEYKIWLNIALFGLEQLVKSHLVLFSDVVKCNV